MNLFLFELKRNVKAFLIWAVCTIFMIAAGMSKYSASAQTGQSMNQFVTKMPRIIQALFGIGNFNLSTAFGFYCVLFMYLVLIAVIHSILLGSTIMSKEERDKTSEFLYTRPITRWSILTMKLQVALLLMVILNLITLFSSLLLVSYYSKGEMVALPIVNMMGGLFLLQLIFFSIGLFCSAAVKNPRTAPALASGMLLFFFLLHKLIELDIRLDWMQAFTPFAYFTASNLTSIQGVPLLFYCLTALIIAGLTTGSYIFYKNRDINF